MADELTFSVPDTTATTVETPIAPVIDPATGEPSLAPAGDATTTVVTPAAAETVVAPVVPDRDSVALAAAARSSFEARTAKKALADAQKEIESLKANGTSTTSVQAELDAIKKDPSLLFKHGWDADKLMKRILDPNAAESTADIEARIEAKLQTKLDAALKVREKTPEEIANEEKTNKDAFDRQMSTATSRVSDLIKSESENFFWVDSDDAPGITKAIFDFCVKEKFEPTPEQGKALVLQGIKQLHDKRSNRDFAKRNGKIVASAQSPASNEGIEFTDGSQKLQQRPEPKPTAKPPQSTGNPLPTRKPAFELGFTRE